MDAPAHAVDIVLTRIEGGRTWMATVAGNHRALGLGPTPAVAVDELFRWSAAFTAPPATAPSGAVE